MRKLVLTCMATISIIGLSLAQEPGSLPQEAQNFIDENFPSASITDMEKFDQILNSEESDLLDFDDQEAYEAELSNGIHIEFGKDGKMTEMASSNEETIPLQALPDMIENYIETNYMNVKIVGYEIDQNDQQIELDNGTDLEFDLDGRFVEED